MNQKNKFAKNGFQIISIEISKWIIWQKIFPKAVWEELPWKLLHWKVSWATFQAAACTEPCPWIYSVYHPLKIDPKYIKIPNRYDFAYILNNGDTRLNSFENAVREILQDELQCVDSIMNYIYFMMNVLNEHNKGARMVVLSHFSKE